MSSPPMNALLAEQARQQVALERMLRTVARWAGLPGAAGGDDGTEGRVASDAQTPTPAIPAIPASRETSRQVDPPHTSGTAPARPRTGEAPAQVLERGTITPARPAVAETDKGWQNGLPPTRSASTASSKTDRYSANDSSNAQPRRAHSTRPAPAMSSGANRYGAHTSSNTEPPRALRQAPPAGRAPSGQEEEAEPPPRRARLRAVANAPGEPRIQAPSSDPLRQSTRLRRARLALSQAYAAAPSEPPNPHPAMARSDHCAGLPDEVVPWERTPRVPAMTNAAPLPASMPPLPTPASSWPEPASPMTPEAAQPTPADRLRPDPFPDSTLEEAMADALERAALEAGIDLT